VGKTSCQQHLLQLILCKKAGLHSFTQHLAMELADYNIRVNAVSPAVVNTTLYHGVFMKRSSRKGT
jgi:NAD(P)-dependent dehydrogenase (short-subunit alcohol dehydrogenase family)